MAGGFCGVAGTPPASRDGGVSKILCMEGDTLAAEIINKGVRMMVCNGQDTLFWRYVWVGDKPLIGLALEHLPLADSFKMVQAYWDPKQG